MKIYNGIVLNPFTAWRFSSLTTAILNKIIPWNQSRFITSPKTGTDSDYKNAQVFNHEYSKFWFTFIHRISTNFPSADCLHK